MTRYMLAPLALLGLLATVPADAQPAGTLAPRVHFETSVGNFVVEVDTVRAPITAENFLRYVRDGAYDGTVFHRVIANFVVQGGGYDDRLTLRTARATIPNESGNGLSNRRGTLGLAREESPHSGSSQFYINLVDNPALDPLPSRWGYAVFGRVVEGMDVVDRIGYLRTEAVANFGGDVPVDRPLVRRAWVTDGTPTTPAEPEPPPPPSQEQAGSSE